MSGLIRILVVGNHPLVRHGLASILVARNGMQVVGEATDGEQAIFKAFLLQPDVILMDLCMPCMDAIRAIHTIRSYGSTAAFVVMTGFEDEGHISEAVLAGALGSLRKDTSPDDLFHAIRTAANDATYPL